MVEKATLSQEDRKKINDLLNQERCGVYVLQGKRGRWRVNKNWSTKQAHKATTTGEIKAKEHIGMYEQKAKKASCKSF